MAEAISLSLLRQARRNRRLTLQQVAEEIGVTEGTMWKYENQKIPLTVERLFELLNLYHVSVVDVIVKEDDSNEDL